MSVFVFMGLFFLLGGTAGAGPSLSDVEMLQKINNILNPRAFYAEVRMRANHKDGTIRRYQFFIRKKGNDRVRIYFKSPAREKGREVLRRGDNLWTYMPSIKKIIRVGNQESFMGGDFNNSDVLRLDLPSDYHVVKRAKTKNGFILFLKASSREVSYQKMDLYTDKNLMPLRQKLYSRTGTLIKELFYKKLKTYRNHTRPSLFVMKNHIRKTTTTLDFTTFRVVKGYPSSIFRRESLGEID